MRLRAAGATLRRIGPRPGLLLRYTAHRLGSARRRRRLRSTYERAVATVPAGARLEAIGPVLAPIERLPPPLTEAGRGVRREADEALAHRVTLLGADGVELGETIPWDLDFKSGHRWAPGFYQDVEVTRLDDASDAKVPWELSRGHQLPVLARAAVIFGEERYARELEAQLEQWLDGNPPGFGINWANPMEVAIRAVNWVWAIGTLDRSPCRLEADLRRRATESLQVHGRHIAANLEGTPYLRSNHYLADILGLLVLGSCLDGDPAARRWARYAQRAFEREILAQVLPDGVGFEASLSYHGLALEMLVLARHTARVSGRPFSGRFDARLRRMLEASRALRLPSGRIPQLGDSDSGRILPAGSSRPPSHDHLLWLGAAELGRGRPLPGPPGPEVAWTLGVDAWRRVAAAAESPRLETRRFDHGGLFVLAGGGTAAVVRCGDVGQNGNGGHAHNDLLSYELFHREPLVVDSGTYVYTADPAARNEFRATAAHNTVAIDGEEINPIDPGELFRLRQVARPAVHGFDQTDDTIRLSASHDGYRRLSCGATHRRDFRLDCRTGELSIADSIEGSGECECVSRVHLAPGSRIRSVEPEAVEVERGTVRFTVRFAGASRLEVIEGWVSGEYGRRQRAPVLVARSAGSLPAALGCRFDFRSA
jgi:uncharacterized heparinase superfamily protein